MEQIAAIFHDLCVEGWRVVYVPQQPTNVLSIGSRRHYSIYGRLSEQGEAENQRNQEQMEVEISDYRDLPLLRQKASVRSTGLRGLRSYRTLDNFYTKFHSVLVLQYTRKYNQAIIIGNARRSSADFGRGTVEYYPASSSEPSGEMPSTSSGYSQFRRLSLVAPLVSQ
ncbi:MAG: hypothetical protein GY799_23710 [Desulfobulbaceae bacterium]|nr:hypothetical protein [Desulfobulbaceae bacterium]